MLAVSDLDTKMRTEVNVLDYAMGCMLSMEYKNGR